MNYQQYAQKTIQKHLAQLIRHRHSVKADKGPEYIHQMRVASRRLRNALWTFKDTLPQENYEKWQNSIRQITRCLSRPRDLDIKIGFINYLLSKTVDKPLQSGLNKLLLVFQAERKVLQPSVISMLNRAEKNPSLLMLEEYLSLPLPKAAAAKSIRKKARKKILKRLEHFLSFSPFVNQPKKINKLHIMRIAAKKLRYTLENFEPFYGGKTKKYLSQMITIQGNLGDIHDYDIWEKSALLTSRHVKGNKNFKAALCYFSSQCRSLRQKAYIKFTRNWEFHNKAKTWQKIRTLVSQ